jgi:hypothetical protein
MIRRLATLLALGLVAAFTATTAAAGTGSDTRISPDAPNQAGYVSAYTLGTGTPYTDPVLRECSIARGRQNEPAVAMDPRNPNVILGSSNDYCGTYAGSNAANGFGQPGPIWEGYYRSEDGGQSFVGSLVPGYPGDTSPYASKTDGVRTAGAGDPVIAWDAHGRAFFGSESSDDPAGSLKTFGDEWVAVYRNPGGPGGNAANDGQQFVETNRVAKGSSAPNLLGVFHDKTAIEADRTGGRCDGNVYFAWSRFSGNAGNVTIDFIRSTDHGHTWSKPMSIAPSAHDVQLPEISVTGDGNVYVTYTQAAPNGNRREGVALAGSTDCGRTFSKPQLVQPFTAFAFVDVADPQPVPGGSAIEEEGGGEADGEANSSLNRDCGDFFSACESGYTFFRADSGVRATADQTDARHDWVYAMYEASKPGTEVNTGTTYGTLSPGVGSQVGVYYTRIDGQTGEATRPVLIRPENRGHQIFPDISADGGVLHALWWDSRNDPTYSPKLPIGNSANGNTHPALDVYATTSSDHGSSWSTPVRLTDVSTNPTAEQYSDRTVPFMGDYLWITSIGSSAYGAWTDNRDVLLGPDPREAEAGDHDPGADVPQCRTFDPDAGWSGDSCPHTGELDSNIYGSPAP